MTRALRAELIKLSTTRTFVALVASALGLSLLLTLLITTLANGLTEDDVRSTFSFDSTVIFILLLGAIGMSGEWRHRTIAPSVLSTPRRLVFLGAKMVAYALAGMALSLIVTVSIMAVGSLILSTRDELTLPVADLADVLWRNLVNGALLGAMGVAFGALVRNTAGVIVLLLAIQQVFEPLLAGLTEVGKFGPTSSAPAGLQGVAGDSGFELLAPGWALLVMVGWVALLFAAAGVTLRQRDLV